MYISDFLFCSLYGFYSQYYWLYPVVNATYSNSKPKTDCYK